MSSIINPFVFASGAPSGPSSTKWRILFRQINVTTNWPEMTEMEMRASVGGADQCSGGTATASSSNGGNVAANAFDNSTGTAWQASAVAPGWLQYEFASAVHVNEVAINYSASENSCPMRFDIQYYDGADWVTHLAEYHVVPFAASTLTAFNSVTTVLGAERVTDPSFNNAGSWTASGGWSVSGGNLVGSAAANGANQAGVFVNTKVHYGSFQYTRTSGSKIRLRSDANIIFTSAVLGSSGIVNGTMTANGTELRIEADTATFTGTLSEITIREVVGSTLPNYANVGGIGNRTASITVSLVGIGTGGGSVTTLVDGAVGNGFFWNGGTGDGTGWVLFDFGSGVTKIIDQFRLELNGSTAQGTWRWEGSNDNSSWTQCGSDFTLGGVSGWTTYSVPNTTAYRYYRLRHMSGSRTTGPYEREIEFRIA